MISYCTLHTKEKCNTLSPPAYVTWKRETLCYDEYFLRKKIQHEKVFERANERKSRKSHFEQSTVLGTARVGGVNENFSGKIDFYSLLPSPLSGDYIWVGLGGLLP